MRTRFTSLLTVIAVTATLWAAGSRAEYKYEGKYLYTAPDRSATGGIRGKVEKPALPIRAVFAIPPHDPLKVYRGQTTGPDGREFVFKGLPIARYDLVIIFEKIFYEGLTLTREENSLTDNDRRLIREIVSASEPFFTDKKVHRVEGTTGKMTGEARAICTFLRAKPSFDYSGIEYKKSRRALKLVLLQDTGPGWQIERTREIFTTFVPPGETFLNHAYRKQLGGIRVVDTIKDMGELDLRAVNE